MSEIHNKTIKENGLVEKLDIFEFIDIFDSDKEITSLIIKEILNNDQNKITSLRAFDSSYFRGKSHFDNDDHDTQDYLVFQLVYKRYKKIANSNHNLAWKSKDCLMKY